MLILIVLNQYGILTTTMK